jgi:Domain of unknown function (DUF4279)
MGHRRPDPPRLDDASPDDLVSAGGPVDRVCAFLRFFGDDLDPEEISRALGRQATSAFRKGDELPGRYHRIARTGSWLLDAPPSDPPDPEESIKGLLAWLSPDLELWRSLTERFAADIFCGLFLNEFNRGFALSASLTRALADRNLVVGFDIYGPVASE